MDVSGTVEINKGIWKTTDGGSNWIALSTTGIDCQTEPGCGVEQGAYNLALALDGFTGRRGAPARAQTSSTA
jgi:hypothetical protein